MFGKRLAAGLLAAAAALAPGAARAWYWDYPNSHWPSAYLYFTSSDARWNYYVHTPGGGGPYLVTPADIAWVRNPTVAVLEVRLPYPDATLYVEGRAMRTRGTLRRFASPPLTPGKNYTYEVRASWVDEDEKEVRRTRKVAVHAGGRLLVDFTRP